MLTIRNQQKGSVVTEMNMEAQTHLLENLGSQSAVRCKHANLVAEVAQERHVDILYQ